MVPDYYPAEVPREKLPNTACDASPLLTISCYGLAGLSILSKGEVRKLETEVGCAYLRRASARNYFAESILGVFKQVWPFL